MYTCGPIFGFPACSNCSGEGRRNAPAVWNPTSASVQNAPPVWNPTTPISNEKIKELDEITTSPRKNLGSISPAELKGLKTRVADNLRDAQVRSELAKRTANNSCLVQ